jgi:hypothetical protein
VVPLKVGADPVHAVADGKRLGREPLHLRLAPGMVALEQLEREGAPVHRQQSAQVMNKATARGRIRVFAER